MAFLHHHLMKGHLDQYETLKSNKIQWLIYIYIVTIIFSNILIIKYTFSKQRSKICLLLYIIVVEKMETDVTLVEYIHLLLIISMTVGKLLNLSIPLSFLTYKMRIMMILTSLSYEIKLIKMQVNSKKIIWYCVSTKCTY